VRHLLLVGAYRDNEVGPAHPLMRMLETVRAAGARVQEIVLPPLRLDDVGELVAAAMRCTPERARPVAQLVHEKTAGNPFFAIQFFTALADEGLIAFDSGALDWKWDLDGIRARNYTDNVADLMTGKLRRLSSPAQEALKQLACLGSVAEISAITNSVFRLPARRTGPDVRLPRLESAPVSEKPVALNRSPRHQGYGY
jgi:predicted ATPase